jgi:hypothetical protein
MPEEIRTYNYEAKYLIQIQNCWRMGWLELEDGLARLGMDFGREIP